MLKNSLEEIEGVGEKTAELLLKAYGSVDVIQQKSEEELSEHVSLSMAKKVLKGLGERQKE